MEISGDLLRKKIENGENVIIDFWANFCGPCRVMKPKFEKVAESNQDKNLEFFTMNVEENKEFAMGLGIRSIPTVKVFSKGSEVKSHTGMLNEDEIKELTKFIING
jgi:thioredoxin